MPGPGGAVTGGGAPRPRSPPWLPAWVPGRRAIWQVQNACQPPHSCVAPPRPLVPAGTAHLCQPEPLGALSALGVGGGTCLRTSDLGPRARVGKPKAKLRPPLPPAPGQRGSAGPSFSLVPLSQADSRSEGRCEHFLVSWLEGSVCVGALSHSRGTMGCLCVLVLPAAGGGPGGPPGPRCQVTSTHH